MNIAYLHASEVGNGARVAEEFRRIMKAKVDAFANRLRSLELQVA